MMMGVGARNGDLGYVVVVVSNVVDTVSLGFGHRWRSRQFVAPYCTRIGGIYAIIRPQIFGLGSRGSAWVDAALPYYAPN